MVFRDSIELLIIGADRAAGGQPAAFMLQQALADRPTAIEITDQIFLRYLDVGEEQLAERRIARDELDRAYFHARGLHVDQQEADAFVLSGIVGSYQTEAPIGVLCPGCPDFLPIDEKIIATVHALRAQRC